MSTLERTISMMEELPETDLVQIQNLIKKLFLQHECEKTDNAAGKVFIYFLQLLKRMETALAKKGV